MRRRAVFLDRDGVLNRAIIRHGKPFPPSTLDELEILPGVEDACRNLRQAGFVLVMVTNQPDVARGAQAREIVDTMNATLAKRLYLDSVKVCFHDDVDNCSCRKPKSGMLTEAAQEWNIDLNSSFMIGDRWKDIEAGRRAGCKTILVYSEHQEKKSENFDLEAASLSAAVDLILHQTTSL